MGLANPLRDETILPGESMSKVESDGSNLSPGDVIRTWSEIERRWKGWWCEVLRIEGDRIDVKDLKSGEESYRVPSGFLPGIGSLWKHPNSERVKAHGRKLGEAYESRLLQLKSQYDAMDFTGSPEEEMIKVLGDELRWRDAHDREYSDMEEEFEIRKVAIMEIGEELNRRGGIELMRSIFKQVPGTRSLELLWGGIGEWMA